MSFITWNQLLDKAPPGSVLMGGAIRDHILFHSYPKDYDIFYPYVPNGIPMIPGWQYKPRPVGEEHPDYDIVADGQQNPIAAVWDYEVSLGPFQPKAKVQLIGVHYADPIEHFKAFDHTLTLGLFSKNHGLYVDPRMFNSYKTKIVTCTNNAKPLKSLERAKTVIKRYWEPDNWSYEGFE